MLAERGVDVDHASVYRWVQKFTPQLEAAFRNGKKRPAGRMPDRQVDFATLRALVGFDAYDRLLDAYATPAVRI